MSFASDIANDWQNVDQTEAVTLFRRQASGGFDAGTAVSNALRRVQQKDEQIGLKAIGLVWHLWASQTGDPMPKYRDVIQDASGARWSVHLVEVQTWGTRYRCTCTKEV